MTLCNYVLQYTAQRGKYLKFLCKEYNEAHHGLISITNFVLIDKKKKKYEFVFKEGSFLKAILYINGEAKEELRNGVWHKINK